MNGEIDQEAREWGMWCHLSAIVAWIPQIFLAIIGLPLPIPLASIVVPLIIWLANRSKHPFIDEQGKESLNFQISLLIYCTIALILSGFLFFTTCGVTYNQNVNQTLSNFLIVATGCSVLFVVILSILQIFLIIFASFRAYKGQLYRYPFTIRFLR